MSQPKIKPEAMIDAITKSRGMVTIAADLLKCSPQTIYNYMERYPDVKAARENARERMLDTAELNLYQAINKGDMTAIIFYLKTQGKRRGYIERQENININVPLDLLQRTMEALEGAGLDAATVFENLIQQAANAALPSGERDSGSA